MTKSTEFRLSKDEIREAIAYWINNEKSDVFESEISETHVDFVDEDKGLEALIVIFEELN